MDALIRLASYLVAPMASHSLHSAILSSLFRFKESKPNKEKSCSVENLHSSEHERKSQALQDEIEHNFGLSERIPFQSWWTVKFKNCFTRSSRAKRYEAMAQKANSRIAKEMDLQKFLHRQRIMSTALLGLLKGRQCSFIDKYSALVLRESTDMDVTSQDEELSDIGTGSLHFVGSMVRSKEKVDKRLISLVKMREEDQNH